MDPHIKLILEKIEKLGGRFSSLESRVDNLSERYTGVESKAKEVSAWKTEIDSSVADLVIKIDVVSDLADKVEATGDLIVKAASVDALKSQVSALAAAWIEWFRPWDTCVGHPAQTGDSRGDSSCR
jgi:CII-binding regulator of phage lambda lysogenization HflD